MGIELPDGATCVPNVKILDRERVIISEARLNDCVYLLFKVAMGMPPREADLQMIMHMVQPQMGTAGREVSDAVAYRSHGITWEVKIDDILEQTITYLEDHWIKGRYPHRAELERFMMDGVIFWMLHGDEADCGEMEK